MRPLLFIDTETTGLDPSKARLLEVAVGVVDPETLTELWSANWVLPCPDLETVFNDTDTYVQNMHTVNGLWADVHQATEGLDTNQISEQFDRTQSEILENLARFGIGHSSKVPICGYNPGFDLGFLQAYLPGLAKVFTHTKGDVRSLELFATGWDCNKHTPNNHSHRAHDDLQDEIEALRHYRRELGQ